MMFVSFGHLSQPWCCAVVRAAMILRHTKALFEKLTANAAASFSIYKCFSECIAVVDS